MLAVLALALLQTVRHVEIPAGSGPGAAWVDKWEGPGELVAVGVSWTVDHAVVLAAENDESRVRTTFQWGTPGNPVGSHLFVWPPNGAPLVESGAEWTLPPWLLGGFDGIDDFAGTSGRIRRLAAWGDAGSLLLTDPALVAQFAGSGRARLPYVRTANLPFSRGGQFTLATWHSIAASVDVTFWTR